jgi:Protein of unknown function (DUF3048) N-terminal domain/Protein of unknown function (DUF3048) C-terminal domain
VTIIPRRAPGWTRGIAAACVVAALGTSLTSCTHHKHPAAASSAPSPSPSSSSSSAARPPAVKAKPVNPLTGLGAPPKTPVIAVKIDDTAPGRPQVGIDKADVVYIEEAEGGLTRLVAVYGTNKPVVGYVRSTRPSDPDLLLQYGKITLAASGGGHDALPILDRSGLKGWIMDRAAPYYSRVYRAQSSYINVVLNLASVAKRVKTPRPKSIGWTWSPSTKSLPKTSARRIVTRVGSQRVEFHWFFSLHKYVRYIDGVPQRAADGKYVATPNVVVQTCTIVPHPQDTDVNGNPSQFTITTGKGAVSVFRNGRRIDGIWSRRGLLSGTRLLDKHGKPIALMPGGAFVALVRKGVKTSAS